jgi:hypothetical protein
MAIQITATMTTVGGTIAMRNNPEFKVLYAVIVSLAVLVMNVLIDPQAGDPSISP